VKWVLTRLRLDEPADAGSDHDEREIEAIDAVLRGGPTATPIGRSAESRVAV
jgi:hypothetical protein